MSWKVKDIIIDCLFVLGVLFVAAAMLVAINEIAYAESVPAAIHEIDPGETVTLHCKAGSDGVTPAINMRLDRSGVWVVYVGCPQIKEGR